MLQLLLIIVYAMATAAKKVLVKFEDRCRPIQFTGDDLRVEIREAFDLNQQEDFFIQIKDEDWGGEFVDVSDEKNIPDKSVIKIVLLKKQV